MQNSRRPPKRYQETSTADAAIVRAAFGSAEARRRGLFVRDYQVEAARQILRALSGGRSAELVLPTGTGKTIIANLVSLLASAHGKQGRALYIAPRRLLAEQHARFTGWLWPQFRPLLIDQDRAADPFRLAALAHDANILISTPELLANTIRARRLPSDIVRTIEFVVADEYDAYMVAEYDATGPRARLEDGFAQLRDALPSNLPTVLVSATSPAAQIEVGSRNPVVKALSEFVIRCFDPIRIEVDPASYAQFVPSARVHPVLVTDDSVHSLDEAIKTQLILAFDLLSILLKGEPDESFVFTRLDAILTGRVQAIPVRRGGTLARAPVSPHVLNILATIRVAQFRFEFLYEDMFDGYLAELQRVRRVRWGWEEPKFPERWMFVAASPHGNYHPLPRAKLHAVAAIARVRWKEKGIIFVRHVRLAEVVHQRLVENGLKVELLHGDRDNIQRRSAVERFSDSDGANLLVITRGTGQRGLDFPTADYAVFYSPKSSEPVSWQEMSRIRSTVAHVKDSFFLVYGCTGEVEKMDRLLEEMAVAGREYKLLPFISWPSAVFKTKAVRKKIKNHSSN